MHGYYSLLTVQGFFSALGLDLDPVQYRLTAGLGVAENGYADASRLACP